MTPKPDPQTVTAAQQRLKEAKSKRKNARLAADRDFWTAVRDEIDSGHLLQADACEAIDFKREYVRRQLKALAAGEFDPNTTTDTTEMNEKGPENT